MGSLSGRSRDVCVNVNASLIHSFTYDAFNVTFNWINLILNFWANQKPLRESRDSTAEMKSLKIFYDNFSSLKQQKSETFYERPANRGRPRSRDSIFNFFFVLPSSSARVFRFEFFLLLASTSSRSAAGGSEGARRVRRCTERRLVNKSTERARAKKIKNKIHLNLI